MPKVMYGRVAADPVVDNHSSGETKILRSLPDLKDMTALAISPKRSAFRRALQEYPFHVAQLISLPAVTCWLAVTGGMDLFRQLGTSVAAGSTVGGITVFCGATYALVATSVVSQMQEGMRASDHDSRDVAQTSALRNAIGEISATAVRIRRDVEGVDDRVDQLAQEVKSFRTDDRHTRKNDPEVWANYAPGSTAYTVNGQCRFDVLSELHADGTTTLRPDYGRLQNWLKRHGRNGLARANVVLFIDDPTEVEPKEVTPQIAYSVTAFRALKKLAAASQVELQLDRVHFYLRRRSDSKHTKSFFVGEYAFGDFGPTVPFVNSYCDHAAMFNVPRTLLDDDVDTYYSPDAVSNYRYLAEALIAGLPSYSLEDLERRYGHLIPGPDLEPPYRIHHVDDRTYETDDEIIACGDHIAIRRRSTRPTI